MEWFSSQGLCNCYRYKWIIYLRAGNTFHSHAGTNPYLHPNTTERVAKMMSCQLKNAQQMKLTAIQYILWPQLWCCNYIKSWNSLSRTFIIYEREIKPQNIEIKQNRTKPYVEFSRKNFKSKGKRGVTFLNNPWITFAQIKNPVATNFISLWPLLISN